MAPTPFTPEQIRAACPQGLVVTIKSAAPGREPDWRQITFVHCDVHGAELEEVSLNAAGEVRAAAVRVSETWIDMQHRAAFPADTTAIVEEAIDTALGSLDCLRYDTPGGRLGERRCDWFALAYPGGPVRSSVWAERGEPLLVTTIESFSTPGPVPA